MHSNHSFDEISIDLMGKYPPTVNGHQYIFAIIDQLREISVTVPILGKIHKSVTTAFIHVIIWILVCLPQCFKTIHKNLITH